MLLRSMGYYARIRKYSLVGCALLISMSFVWSLPSRSAIRLLSAQDQALMATLIIPWRLTNGGQWVHPQKFGADDDVVVSSDFKWIPPSTHKSVTTMTDSPQLYTQNKKYFQ